VFLYDLIAQVMDERTKLQPFKPADRKSCPTWEDIEKEAGELRDLQGATASAKAKAALVSAGQAVVEDNDDHQRHSFVTRQRPMFSASVVDAPRGPAANTEQHTPVKRGGGRAAAASGGSARALPSGSPPAGARKGGGRAAAAASASGASAVSSRVVATQAMDDGDVDVEFVLWGFSVKSKIAGVPKQFHYTRVRAWFFFCFDLWLSRTSLVTRLIFHT